MCACAPWGGSVMEFQIRTDDYEERVRGSFGRQGFMGALGARLTEVRPDMLKYKCLTTMS